MTYNLVKVERAENVNDDKHRIKAVSNDQEKLKTYCEKTYGKKVGRLNSNWWEDYFIIDPRPDVVIL